MSINCSSRLVALEGYSLPEVLTDIAFSYFEFALYCFRILYYSFSLDFIIFFFLSSPNYILKFAHENLFIFIFL